VEEEFAMRIAKLLAEQQVAFESLPHAPAFTAQKLAKSLHVPGRQVAKCVLLRGSSGFLLAILPATHQIEVDRLARYLGGEVRLATGEEIASIFPDCEWGVVPPFGTLYGIRTLLDDSLAGEDMMVFEDQTHVEAIRLRCADFERLEKPLRFPFSKPA
jgi:Ala-tRNA(Pro) deacylase